MINSIVDFQGWKSTSNHWLPTNGRIPNACVEGFVYGLEGPQYEEPTMHVNVWDVHVDARNTC